ncbi:MAG: hypothetical protein IJZ10_08660 [Thermoguttaceae bacterium]|nr:hypothetical protein [Thermoguttaceae bacterium]
MRRRAVRDLTEERANETVAPRDHVQRWRQWSTRRDAKKIRDELPELEKAIAEVGGDDAAALILGRETFLKAREYVEAWDDSRDWIDLKTEQKVDLNAYAAQKIAGTPKEAAAILRRYAADAKAQERTVHAMAPFWRDVIDAVKGKFKPVPAPFVETGKEKFKAALDELEKTKPKFAALRNTANAATLEDAAALLRKATGITADFSGFTVDDANEIVNGIFDFFAEFGRVGTIHQIQSAPDLGGYLGLFETGGDLGELCRVSLLNKGWREKLKKGYEEGDLISGRPRAIIQHELGHALATWIKRNDTNGYTKLDLIKKEGKRLRRENKRVGSKRSFWDKDEFIAELVAEHLEAPTEHTKRLLGILRALTEKELQEAFQ